MKVRVFTPEKMLFEGEAHAVTLPGQSGSFQVLNRHAPLRSVLKKGALRLETHKNTHTFPIQTGIASVEGGDGGGQLNIFVQVPME